MMAKSPILGGFSTARVPGGADNAAVNLLLEVTETKDGKVPGFLFLSSGLDLIGTLGDGPGRGALPLNDVLYFVSGPSVYSLTPNGVATLLGSIGDGTAPVSMFQNGRQLMIVDGVAGWLVPGGYPLTGGVIPLPSNVSNPGGRLYAVNDTITLQASSGFQSSYPIVRVTEVSSQPATSVVLGVAGTTYNTAANVPTTRIQPQRGNGSGFTIDITGASGKITSSVLNSGGTGYAVGDTGRIATNAGNAIYQVWSIGGGGAVTAYVLLNPGSSYYVQTNAPTEPGGPPNNLGSGMEVFLIATAGPLSALGLNTGGHGYAVGNVGLITGGSGDATYIVSSVGPNGTVTDFEITQLGAITDPATSFSQRSTSGAGQGFTLTSPTYGARIELVPVDLPFPNPLVGDMCDGFGVLMFLGSQNVAASESLDLSTWPALSYGVAAQSPDKCMSVHVIHDEIYVLKTDNTEIWVNQGLPNFPFAPITSVHMEVGCMAPFSVAVADEDLIWLARNDQGQGIVVSATGSRPVTISTQALVSEFQKYPNLGDAIAYVRQEGGHVLYVITFPEANKTWCYDKTASALVGYPVWTQPAAFDNGDLTRHWGNAFTPWTGTVRVVNTPVAFQPQAVTINTLTELDNDTLVGLPLSFSAALFNLWLDIPDSTGSGVIFTNQDDETLGSTNPGLFVKIQNDTQGTPQITIKAWDAANAIIVSATYDFTTWDAWTDILISFDTASNQIEVYANTTTSDVVIETRLTGSVSWSSTNPIANPSGHAWRLIPVS